jgi:hypothetical protein
VLFDVLPPGRVRQGEERRAPLASFDEDTVLPVNEHLLALLGGDARLAHVVEEAERTHFIPKGGGKEMLRRLLKVYEANEQASRRYLPDL